MPRAASNIAMHSCLLSCLQSALFYYIFLSGTFNAVLAALLCLIKCRGKSGLMSVSTEQVKIFTPVKNPEQSGLSKAIDGPGKGPLWRMEIDNRQKYALHCSLQPLLVHPEALRSFIVRSQRSKLTSLSLHLLSVGSCLMTWLLRQTPLGNQQIKGPCVCCDHPESLCQMSGFCFMQHAS